MNLIQMADSIHKLQDKLQRLQSEVTDISTKKSEGQEELNDLHNEIINTKEKLDLVKKTFNIKYEELKETCSQTQKLQNYVEQFKNGQDYEELESIVRKEIGKSLLDNRKLLQNALFSVLLALRNDPDRHLIVDKMELTPFTTTILNGNSFRGSGRSPDLQGSEQFISERLLVVAGGIFSNLQKVMVNSTMAAAAGLGDGRSHATAYTALPY
jgi:archaellum component FlaC